MRIISMVSTAFALVLAAAASAQVTYSNRPPPSPPSYQPAYAPGQQGNYPGQPGYPGGAVKCESQDNRLVRCRVPSGWRGVRLVQRFSDSACVEGRTWGFDQNTIWVTQGCRAGFAQASWNGGYPTGPGSTVVCESNDNRPQRCGVARDWRGARLVQQLSKSACVEGGTWGFDQGGIWVTQGCRARFAPAAGGGWQPGLGWNRDFAVSCGSPQYHYHFCRVDVGARGRVVLRRQTSDTRCVEGRNWGWNRAGIWVDKGCGAQFLVTRRW